jgi:ribokinase
LPPDGLESAGDAVAEVIKMKSLAVGGAMIDTIAIIDSDRVERMTMLNADASFLLLEEGRKTEAEVISTHPGGGAINAAVAMARLGVDAAVLAKLGTDARADAILARLAAEGVSSRWAIRDSRASTGASVLVSSHERNATVFTFRGANTLLEPDDLRDDAFAVDLVYLANLSNQSADCFPAIVGRARAHGALVAANPGPRQLSARGQAFLENLAAIDILVLNRTEADLLVPILATRARDGGPPLAFAPGEKPPALAVRGLAAGGFEMGIAPYLRALARLGPRHVAVTDGAHGAFVGSAQELLYAPAMRSNVVGTTGAGDAFSATFAVYVALGRPPDEALRAATINAGSVVGHIDTQTGLMRRDELDRRLAATPPQPAIRRWAT